MSFNLANVGPHSSEFVPSTLNASSITQLAKERKREFESCNRMVTEAHAKLQDLLLMQKDLETDYFKAATLLAPIRRLPDEMLGRIMLFAFPNVFEWNEHHQYKIGPGKGDVQ
ncbi:hypothetical protein M422DRAFT_273126, partial [Sphaerobolus stellatus SS14]